MRTFGLDIGNSRAKLHELPTGPPPSAPSHRAAWIAACPSWNLPKDATLLPAIEAAAAGGPFRLHVVSVDPEATSRVARLAAEVVVWSTERIPVRHPYDEPTTLGPDRLLAALAVQWLDEGRGAIVVDAGTAVTVDLVAADGTFLGGAIAPGKRLLAESLARGGALLSAVRVEEAWDYPGTSTRACLEAGVLAAFEGALERLVGRARDALPAAAVWTTGGDGAHAARHLASHGALFEPALLRLGLARLEHGSRG